MAPAVPAERKTSPRTQARSSLVCVDDRLRLTDILTTASAAANFTGERDVQLHHLAVAIDLLLGRKTLDDLGRPQSPMVSRMTGAGSGAASEVKELAQRWFEKQRGDVMYALSEAELEELAAEIAALAAVEPSAPS